MPQVLEKYIRNSNLLYLLGEQLSLVDETLLAGSSNERFRSIVFCDGMHNLKGESCHIITEPLSNLHAPLMVEAIQKAPQESLPVLLAAP